MKQIIYKDKLRDVVVLAKPSENYLMLDLTEYTGEEKDYYEEGYNIIHQEYLAQLKELGVYSNYRNFKEEKIQWVDSETM